MVHSLNIASKSSLGQEQVNPTSNLVALMPTIRSSRPAERLITESFARNLVHTKLFYVGNPLVALVEYCSTDSSGSNFFQFTFHRELAEICRCLAHQLRTLTNDLHWPLHRSAFPIYPRKQSHRITIRRAVPLGGFIPCRNQQRSVDRNPHWLDSKRPRNYASCTYS